MGAGVGKKEEAPADAVSSGSVEASEVVAPELEAAEVKVPTEIPAADGDEKVALAPALWFDPDVRWLTGVHEAEGHYYLVRERYEELLWWLLMPSLLRLAGEPAPSRADVEELSKTVAEALTTSEAAGYRIDALLGSAAPPEAEEAEVPVPEDDSKTIEQGTAQGVEPEPQQE